MPTAKKATIFPAKKARKPTATLIRTRRKTLRKTSNAWAATLTTSRPKPPPSACFTYRAEKWPILLWKQNHGWANSPTACRRGRQSLKFGIRLTNTRFGEVMPSRILSGSGFQGDNYAIMCKIAEWPQAWVKQHAYNIDYTWKPQNSRWLDLQASLWATRTKSKPTPQAACPEMLPGLTTNGTAITSTGCMAAQEHAPARKTACPIPTAASIPAKAKPCMPPTTATVLPFPTK